MSVDIRLKHSSTKDKAPVAADLKAGEIALSIHPDSPAAYIKDSAGNIVAKVHQPGLDPKKIEIEAGPGVDVLAITTYFGFSSCPFLVEGVFFVVPFSCRFPPLLLSPSTAATTTRFSFSSFVRSTSKTSKCKYSLGFRISNSSSMCKLR